MATGPKIHARTREPVGRIAKRAAQIPDQVQRLRFLRGSVIMDRTATRKLRWLPAAGAIGAAAAVTTAVVMWTQFWR